MEFVESAGGTIKENLFGGTVDSVLTAAGDGFADSGRTCAHCLTSFT
jgi:hypothetical protein